VQEDRPRFCCSKAHVPLIKDRCHEGTSVATAVAAALLQQNPFHGIRMLPALASGLGWPSLQICVLALEPAYAVACMAHLLIQECRAGAGQISRAQREWTAGVDISCHEYHPGSKLWLLRDIYLSNWPVPVACSPVHVSPQQHA
jgi:hypothetical protein